MDIKGSIAIDKEKRIIFVILIIWFLFSFKMLVLQFNAVFNYFPDIYSLDLERIRMRTEGDFYSFIRFCETKVPERTGIIFRTSPPELTYGCQDWLAAEYLFSKSSYYLYPRMIFKEKEAPPNIKYKIIYNALTNEISLIF